MSKYETHPLPWKLWASEPNHPVFLVALNYAIAQARHHHYPIKLTAQIPATDPDRNLLTASQIESEGLADILANGLYLFTFWPASYYSLEATTKGMEISTRTYLQRPEVHGYLAPSWIKFLTARHCIGKHKP